MKNISYSLNKQAVSIPPSGIRSFFDIVEKRHGTLSLGVGEPDFVTPQHILDAGIDALSKGHTYYTSNAGLFPLREAVCAYLKRRFSLSYAPENEVLITVGGSEAIDLVIRSIIEPGDEVLIPEPTFVCYAPCVTLAGGFPVPIETSAADDFRLTARMLSSSITPRTKLLVFPFPNNPTGGIMEKKDLEEVSSVLQKTNIFVLSDEIYGELTYGTKHVSIASLPEMRNRTVLVSGFSKAYAMTGWRLGYACAPSEIIALMTKIHQYTIMSTPTISQYAALEALTNGDADIDAMRTEYDVRRQFMLSRFRDMGLSCFEPRGAFYAFPSIRTTGLDSETFARMLLEEENIAVVPGNAFGKSGEGYIRCSYASSLETIQKALDGMEHFIMRRRMTPHA